MFIPFQPFEEFIDLERYCRARYMYEKAPTEANRAAVEQAAREAPRLFEGGHDPWRGNADRAHPGVIPESRFFRDGYHVAVLRHPRYGAVSWHSHDFFELIYACSGEAVHWLGEREFHVRPGDFFILPPNLPHALYADRDDALIVNVLIRKSTFAQVFQPLVDSQDILSEFFSGCLYRQENNDYLLFTCGEDADIRTRVRAMYDEYISGAAYSPAVLVGMLAQLLGLLLRAHRQDAYRVFGERTPCQVNISRMLSYVQEHILNVTLEDVAREFAYSKSRVSVLIKQATGKNFRDIVREQKARQAAELLQSSDMSVEAVAARLDYPDASQFYKAFRAVYHMTPAQYRKESATHHP